MEWASAARRSLSYRIQETRLQGIFEMAAAGAFNCSVAGKERQTTDSNYFLSDDWEQTPLAAALDFSWITLELLQQPVADLVRDPNRPIQLSFAR